MESLKFRLIYWLDKNPDYCWPSLVFWALKTYPLFSIFNSKKYKEQICRKGNEGTPYAYCGKCEHTGKF